MVEKTKTIVLDKVIGFKIEKEETFISTQDSILYALGIGFSEDPLNKKDLNFTYENSEDFKCFPTIIGAHALKYTQLAVLLNPYIPKFNMMSLLHGEQWTEIIKPFSPDAKYYMDAELLDFEDKGSGTIFMVGSNTYNEDNEIVGKVRGVVFIRDIKGHNYKSSGILKNYSIPNSFNKEAFITRVIVPTNKNQAILYRIGGKDLNPLHIDSEFSALGGFEFPILHGLCFYGIACKALYEAITPNDLSKLSYFNARFTSHVFPGETLDIALYKGDNGKIIVVVKTKERGRQVLIGEALIKEVKF